MAEKIIKNPGDMVCPRWTMSMSNSFVAQGMLVTRCGNCEHCKALKDGCFTTGYICERQEGKPKAIKPKSISDPDKLVCHKFIPNMKLAPVPWKNGGIFKFIKTLSIDGKKGRVVDLKKDAIPFCFYCIHCVNKCCVLQMHPHTVIKEINGQPTLVYDVANKIKIV